MSLIRYNNPWSLFDALQRELSNPQFNRLNDDDASAATANWAPSVDIKESDQAFTLLADIPGVDPKDIEISMEKGVLTIKGERNTENVEEGDNYRRVERQSGTFYRRFTLPDSADAEHIEAHGKNGVLEIVLPKLEKVQPRKISVKS